MNETDVVTESLWNQFVSCVGITKQHEQHIASAEERLQECKESHAAALCREAAFRIVIRERMGDEALERACTDGSFPGFPVPVERDDVRRSLGLPT